MEEHEFDHRGFVRAAHAIGLPGIAPRHVIEHVHDEGGDAALLGFGEGGLPRAVDQAYRQMEKKIDQPLAGSPAD